jgi:hypothetical protein
MKVVARMPGCGRIVRAIDIVKSYRYEYPRLALESGPAGLRKTKTTADSLRE